MSPPLAENVVTTAVIDTIGSSHAIWERTYEWNRGRRQVWIGELGDPTFEQFCGDREIPLFRFDWQVIAAAAASFGVGAPPLTTSRLSQREAPAPAYRVCYHREFDEEFENLVTRLYEVQRIGRDEAETPTCIPPAFALTFLLGRLACPISAYNRHAAFTPFVRTTADLVRVIEGARDGDFRGRWNRALSHWPSVKGSFRRLLALAEEECPKWWALIERVDAARAAGERLRIVCQTKVERAALAESLVASGEVRMEEFDTFVTVATPNERLPYGDGHEMPTRIFLAPAPKWLSSVYLSGEAGGSEFFCYPGQARQVVHAFKGVWASQTQPARNHEVLDGVGIHAGVVAEAPLMPPPVVELEPFSYDRSAPAARVQERDRVREFWERAVELYGNEVEFDDANIAAEGTRDVPARGNVLARRVSFAEGPSVCIAEDGKCDVLRRLGGTKGTRVDSMPPRDLRPGMHVAVLPGAERGTILDELLNAWDAQLGSAKDLYEDLWRRALDRAVEVVGSAGLARICGLSEAAVSLWVRGETKPQQRAALLKVIDLSGDQLARDNAAAIVHYIRHTRGVHRIIGRALNEAVGETVVAGDRRSVRLLERLVGRELDDLFAAVQVLTVFDVSEPESVPAVLLGRFLDPDELS